MSSILTGSFEVCGFTQRVLGSWFRIWGSGFLRSELGSYLGVGFGGPVSVQRDSFVGLHSEGLDF